MEKKRLTPRVVSAEYWRDRAQFADFFNAVLYGGRQVINPEDLEDSDTDGSSVFEHREYSESLEQSRDSIKIWKNMAELAVLGIEGQEGIHYGMSVRIMGYDYLAYKKQYDDKAASYREKGGLKGSSEFLSGIKRTDKLLPVVTVVIYYGQEPWDAAESLHGMLDIPKGMEKYVSDYRICVVEARHVSLKFRNKNNRNLFELLGIILDRSIPKGEAKEKAICYGREHKVDKAVVRTIAGVTNSNIEHEVFEKEDAGMYTIFDEEREEGREEGRKEGRMNGIIETMYDDGKSEEEIIDRLIIKFSLSEAEAREKLLAYPVMP